jgi:hypothetical protein
VVDAGIVFEGVVTYPVGRPISGRPTHSPKWSVFSGVIYAPGLGL